MAEKIKLIPADRIAGMMPTPQLAVFATKASKARSVVEIGCWRGRTTRALCDNCPGTVYAVDTFKGSDGIEEELAFMRSVTNDPDWLLHEFQHNLKGCFNLSLLHMSSLEAAPHFPDSSLDLVIIDAAHDYESVFADISAWWPKIALHGTLCGHDMSYYGVWQAVVKFFPTFPVADITADIWEVTKVPESAIRGAA